MLKGITAIGILLLSGFNYLKPIQETYTNLNGFYTIEKNSYENTESIQLFFTDEINSKIIVYDTDDLKVKKSLSYIENTLYYINYVMDSLVLIENNRTTPSITTVTNPETNKYNYIFFNNIKVKNSELTKYNLQPQNEINGNYIVNKTYNLANFNPVGFLNHNYSENFLIPAAITTPIDLMGNQVIFYKNYRVTEFKSYWVNAQASYIQNIGVSNSSTTIAKVTDDNYKIFLYANLKYYDENNELKLIYTSTAVYDNRIENFNVVGTYLTNKLNNINDNLYIVGYDATPTEPAYPINTYFDYYDITNGTGITINGNIGDVFALLSQCFMGIGGFFGIALLPGITLGALFFLPFIVSLIIWLINLFKRH